MTYVPDPELLERYAALLVDFALGGGDGIGPGDTVLVTCPENAKPLYAALCRAVWRSGGNVISHFLPASDDVAQISRDFYEMASGEQLDFFAEREQRGLIDEIDHSILILSETNPHALKGIPPERILRARRALGPAITWRQEKEAAGVFTWTIALYGTEAMAGEARLTIEEYWEQIVKACFLDDPDPVARWREAAEAIERTRLALDALDIDRLHVTGEDADLWLTLGERRRWAGGSGRNIPSFEVFTSPDWRGTEGWIRFSEPLYIFGSLITGVRLRFEAGRVVEATAEENEPLLREMVASDGADRVGEFSLTDARLSRIDRFMANTLYDENVGGPFGNTHLAVGRSLHQAAYDGDAAELSEADIEGLGFNVSSVHTDIVSTTDRTVTAVLRDGTETIIYAGGHFTVAD